MVRSMMSLTDFLLSFCGYVLETATFTLNRAPSKSVEMTPYELWNGKKPNLSFLKIWGCDVYVKRLQPNKLEPKSDKCVFLGYPRETVGYSFYHKTEGKVFVAKNGIFLEKEFIEKGLGERMVQLQEVREPEQTKQSTAAPDTVLRPQAAAGTVLTPPTAPEAPALTSGVNASTEAVTKPHRSSRLCAPPERYGDEVLLLDNDEPDTYKEAMMGPDSVRWL
jgi:hypothetical protein